MNLTPKRLAVLEEFYYEGPMTHLTDWRAFNALFKAGLVEANYVELPEAIASGYVPTENDPDDPADYVLVDCDALWRISQKGRDALEAYYEKGTVAIVPPLEHMICVGRA